MRKPIIAGNWKMHKTVEEALDFARAVEGKLPDPDQVDAVLCAPFLALPALTAWANGQPIGIGAQNMHFEDQGAYTGEISPVMLKTVGVQYVIIGHSERRQYFNETSESVGLKAKAAHRHGLIPIICVGETLKEREGGQTRSIVESQVVKALSSLTADEVERSVLAYEPVWAIGSGQTPTPEEANQVANYIRQAIAQQFNQAVAQAVRIQYGGSVNPDNLSGFMKQTDIDGALVGGASLKPDLFLQLLEGGRG
jgi:triosephosphate isomerase